MDNIRLFNREFVITEFDCRYIKKEKHCLLVYLRKKIFSAVHLLLFSYFHPNISVVSFIKALPQEVNRHLPPISHELTSSFECCFLKKGFFFKENKFFINFFMWKFPIRISEGLIDKFVFLVWFLFLPHPSF